MSCCTLSARAACRAPVNVGNRRPLRDTRCVPLPTLRFRPTTAHQTTWAGRLSAPQGERRSRVQARPGRSKLRCSICAPVRLKLREDAKTMRSLSRLRSRTCGVWRAQEGRGRLSQMMSGVCEPMPERKPSVGSDRCRAAKRRRGRVKAQAEREERVLELLQAAVRCLGEWRSVK